MIFTSLIGKYNLIKKTNYKKKKERRMKESVAKNPKNTNFICEKPALVTNVLTRSTIAHHQSDSTPKHVHIQCTCIASHLPFINSFPPSSQYKPPSFSITLQTKIFAQEFSKTRHLKLTRISISFIVTTMAFAATSSSTLSSFLDQGKGNIFIFFL